MVAAADFAEQQGDLDRARTLFAQAAALDPLNDRTIVSAATFELRHSGARAARELLERSLSDLPASAEMWASLGDARLVLDDAEGARRAYETALQIDPDQQIAKSGLGKVHDAGA